MRTAGTAVICLLLWWSGVLGDLFDCTAFTQPPLAVNVTTLTTETGPLYRYITSHVTDGKGTPFCDAAQPEQPTSLGQAPAQADGLVVVNGEVVPPSVTRPEERAWAIGTVPPHLWLLPPEPPPR
jgi:hypothetical protein